MNKNIKLGKFTTKQFDDLLILGFSKKWLSLNNEKPIEFDIEITKKGKLILSSTLEKLDKTREVLINEM